MFIGILAFSLFHSRIDFVEYLSLKLMEQFTSYLWPPVIPGIAQDIKQK